MFNNVNKRIIFWNANIENIYPCSRIWHMEK